MKRSFLLWLPVLLIPIIVAATILFQFSQNTASLTEVILSSESMGNKSFTQDEELLFYSELIRSAEVIEEAARPREDYEALALTVKDLTSEKHYTLLLSGSPADCLFTDADGTLFRIATENARQLLLLEGLEYVNPHSAFPEIVVGVNSQESSVVDSQTVSWNYRLSDGTLATRNQAAKEQKKIDLPAGLSPVISFSRTPDWDEVTVRKGNQVLYRDRADNLSSFSYPSDGELLVTVQAKWNEGEGRSYYGETTAEFLFCCDAPAEFALSTNHATPGELLTILAKNCQAEELTWDSTLPGMQKAKAIEYGGEKVILWPLPLQTALGTYPITLRAGDVETTLSFVVDSKEFSNETLTNLDIALMQQAYQGEEEVFRALMAAPSPQALWNGTFSEPIGGEDTWISSRFGAYVQVGTTDTGIRHGGLDYVQLPQSFVWAVNDGVVIYADKSGYSGNTVIIDHGLGIYSVYSSLDTLEVSPGMKVYKSQTVGTLGNTGFAGGNVLHFEIRVLGECVNPFSFLGKEPDFFNLRLNEN